MVMSEIREKFHVPFVQILKMYKTNKINIVL